MSGGYSPHKGETDAEFRERLLRLLEKKDSQLDDYRAEAGAPIITFGHFTDGVSFYLIRTCGSVATILSHAPAPDMPASGTVVGSTLYAWGIAGKISEDKETITWSNGSVWSTPKKVRMGRTRYKIKITKEDGPNGCRDVGLDIEVPAATSSCLRITHIKEGLVKKHNDACTNPAYFIHTGDDMIEINGKQGNAHILRSEVKDADVLEILMSPGHTDVLRRKSLATTEQSIDTDGGTNAKPVEECGPPVCRCGHTFQVNERFCSQCGTQVPLARCKNPDLSVDEFDICGRWTHGLDVPRIFQIQRAADRLYWEEEYGHAKNNAELVAMECEGEDWYVGRVDSFLKGLIRFRADGCKLTYQFKRDVDEEWGEPSSATLDVLLDLEFFAGKAGKQRLSFDTRPLGFTLDSKTRCIKSVAKGAGAGLKGAKVGWQLKTINGNPVDDMNFRTILRFLDAGSEGLPETLWGGKSYETIEAEVEATVKEHYAQEKKRQKELSLLDAAAETLGLG